MSAQAAASTLSDSIRCAICGGQIHVVKKHLSQSHPEWTIEEYQAKYPSSPLLSPKAMEELERVRKRRDEEAKAQAEMSAQADPSTLSRRTKQAFDALFDLGGVAAAKNAKGESIPITVLARSGTDDDMMIPEVDKKYVFPLEVLKNLMMAIETASPALLWGHAGVGKTTLVKQVAARTNRPFFRVQHTQNMEETHIVGQTLANEKGTYFEPGPLPLAMKNGWLYVADEYDFASPAVTSVYQAVMEGEPLVIKEAPREWRVVKPHPDFRFVATGNTNGSGDETGLYQGTQMGNAANYSRFAVTEHVPYMEKEHEISVICKQSGAVKGFVSKLVEFAGLVRQAFDNGEIAMTIGPRELINAAKFGGFKIDPAANRARNMELFSRGLVTAYINRLSKADREIVEAFRQRVFGGGDE